jgi:hypothetical protein
MLPGTIVVKIVFLLPIVSGVKGNKENANFPKSNLYFEFTSDSNDFFIELNEDRLKINGLKFWRPTVIEIK